MSHDIETMAWTGAVPWHTLGKQVREDLTPDEMLEEAGLAWTVSKRVLYYHGSENQLLDVGDKVALVRDSDNKLLDVVGPGWEHVQNEVAFRFFTAFVGAGGCTMETAGSLDGGRRIWGLARLGSDFTLEGGDRVLGYLLLTSSHRTGFSTIAKVTPIRVVCANTMALALRHQSQFEARFAHNRPFDPVAAVSSIGIAREAMVEFAQNAELLRRCKMSEKEVISLLAPVYSTAQKVEEIEEIGLVAAGPSLTSVMQSYYKAPGATPGSAWGVLNAVTHHADHKAGDPLNNDRRLQSAWLGDEAKRKTTVLAKLLELV